MNLNKRNTAKEKAKENKRFPYRHRHGEIKYRIVDKDGISYGEFISHKNALNEIKRQEKFFLRFDLMIEHL